MSLKSCFGNTDRLHVFSDADYLFILNLEDYLDISDNKFYYLVLSKAFQISLGDMVFVD